MSGSIALALEVLLSGIVTGHKHQASAKLQSYLNMLQLAFTVYKIECLRMM